MDPNDATAMTHFPSTALRNPFRPSPYEGVVTHPGETNDQALLRQTLAQYPTAPTPAPAPDLPAPTQVAVNGASAAAGSDAVATPQSVPVPYPKGPVNRDTSPYPGVRGIDLTNARPNATPGFSLPTFNAAPPAVAQAAGQLGGGLGLIPPHISSALDSFESEARPLLSSSGIVDRLRGRTLMRQRSQLMADTVSGLNARTQGVNAETNQVHGAANLLGAQTGAYRATNEVPLALLAAMTHKYGTDVGAQTAYAHDTTLRDINLENTGVQRYGYDLAAAEKQPLVARQDLVNRRIEAGDLAGAHDIGSVGVLPRIQRNVSITPSMTEPGVVYEGTPEGVNRLDKSYFDARDPTLMAKRKQLTPAAVGR